MIMYAQLIGTREEGCRECREAELFAALSGDDRLNGLPEESGLNTTTERNVT